MDCREVKKNFADYLAGNLDTGLVLKVKDHLISCQNCREEVENMDEIWTKLGVLPEVEPSKKLRDRFYTMLKSYKEQAYPLKKFKGIRYFLGNIFNILKPRSPLYQFSILLVLLVLGIFIGSSLRSPEYPVPNNKLQSRESDEIRKQAVLSLLKEETSSNRLLGVNWTSKLVKLDDTTLNALLNTLDNDPNVNVRLSVVDALYLFRDNQSVKDGLLRSIFNQESPLVQLAIINLLTDIRERRAIDALKKLIQKQQLNPAVIKQAKLSLKKII